MDAGAALVAGREPSETVEPGEGALHDPPRAAEPTAMRGPAFRQAAGDATAFEGVAMRLGIVRAIALDQVRFPGGRSRPTAQGRDGVHQREQLGDVGAIGPRQNRGERNTLRFREEVVLAPRLTAIGWVRSSFFPPRKARSEALSTTAQSKLSSPRWRSSARSTAWSFFHTPARCQRASRRQQTLPDPHPISRGNMFHGMPLRRTNRMPVSTARSGIGLRPAYCRWRDRRLGSTGSIRAHSASSTSVMRDRLAVGHATVPSLFLEYKRLVS